MKKSNYIEVIENFVMQNKDKILIKYKLFSKSTNLKINVEITKNAIVDPHALYLPLTINSGSNPECHFETAGATVKLDEENLPFSCKHFVTTQNWISYHGSEGGVTVATKDCPLWLVGGLNYGKFNKDHKVKRNHKMISPWLYNNYWNTNFLANESGLIKYEFTINFELKKDLMSRIKSIMPHIFEPVTHHYMERGKNKFNKLNLFNIYTNHIFITDVKKNKLSSHVYCLNYSNKKEILSLASDLIKIKRIKTETLGNKKLETIVPKKNKFLINFKPHEWKIVIIS